MPVTLLLAALLCAPQVRLAPDQPLPYVFADEPVIVEFHGDERLDFDVMIVYGTKELPSNSHGLGPIALKAGRPYWTTTNLDPVRYGTYSITLNLQWPTGSEQHDFRLQRIRRPEVVNPVPMMIRIPTRSGPWETIRRVLPISQVSIESTHPDLERLLEVFAREGVAVRLLLRSDAAAIPETATPMSIAIPAGVSAEVWARTARRIRERIPAARTVLESPSPELLVELLRSGAAQFINTVSVGSEQALLENRAAAEREGYESIPYSIYIMSATDLIASAHAWRAGAYVAEVGIESIWLEDELTREFGILNAMIHLFDQSRVAGRYMDGQTQTIILREVAPQRFGHWLAPMTQPDGHAAADRFYDDSGNQLPERSSDAAYAAGANPDIVLTAIAFEIREEALALRRMTNVNEVLPDEVTRAVDRLIACDGMISMRAEFFSLLRSLPTLEEAWHGGRLRKSDAVPAIACIERIVRLLAALEQTLGIPFVESLEETLDRSAEQQALYLTATPGDESPQRGEQLMMHISSLITQARTLYKQERFIEASAIAALAEWRARALVHAATARPLTEIEPEPRRN